MKPYLIAILLCVVALGAGLVVYSKTTKKPSPPQVSLASSTPTPGTTTTPSPNPTPIPTPVAQPKTTLIFGGDIMLGRGVENNMRKYGYGWPLAKLAGTMKTADLTVINLESPFSTDAPTTSGGSLILRGHPGGIVNLTDAGVDVASLANNHITDMGTAGVRETTDLLDRNGISHAGAGLSKAEAQVPVIVEKNGLKFGFLSYAYGVNIERSGIFYNRADPAQVTKDVTALKPTVDVVTVLCHCGTEYSPTANASQKEFFHAAIDAGATLAIGHHPHIPEPVEEYKDGIIIYSLGNLVFDQDQVANRNFSALASIELTGMKVNKLSLLPYQIFNYGQPDLATSDATKQKVWNLFQFPQGSKSY